MKDDTNRSLHIEVCLITLLAKSRYLKPNVMIVLSRNHVFIDAQRKRELCFYDHLEYDNFTCDINSVVAERILQT